MGELIKCKKCKIKDSINDYTNPCPSKAIDTSILNVTPSLMNTDANSDQILESLTANNKNSDLINNVISNEVPSPTQKKSYSKKEQFPSK
jgi:uncharacterized lipoprotein YajG